MTTFLGTIKSFFSLSLSLAAFSWTRIGGIFVSSIIFHVHLFYYHFIHFDGLLRTAFLMKFSIEKLIGEREGFLVSLITKRGKGLNMKGNFTDQANINKLRELMKKRVFLIPRRISFSYSSLQYQATASNVICIKYD